MSFEIMPIGIIHSPHVKQDGTPIQGAFAKGMSGTVEVFGEYASGLTDIEGFDYIWLLYGFHQSKGYSLTVRPYLDANPRGVFATRAPRRPNPIGLSLVRLLERKGNILKVTELDILDDTPLFDIKPYVPDFDSRPGEIRIGWLMGKLKEISPPKADGRFASDE